MVALLAMLPTLAWCQLTDPLGNELPFGGGTPLYSFDASYELLGGESGVRREKQFREKTEGLNHYTFDIRRPNIRHQLTIGNFASKFSSFGLNKELFDAMRWTVTVPRARGSATGILARLTSNTFDVNGNPIEGHDIRSTGDWFLAGLRAEANLGAWYVDVGDTEVAIPLPQLGVSIANRFFTNYDLARTTNPFQGVTVATPPSELLLRFRDDSPDDGHGARVYRVRVLMDGEPRFDFEAGSEPPGVLDLPTSSRVSPDGDSRVADAEASFTYRFPLLNAQDIGSVEFIVEVSGDYLAELSADGTSFMRRLQAKGNVRDDSNRHLERFVYGELTDETTFGFDVQTTLWEFAIEGERTWYTRTVQYPIYQAAREQDTVGAWYLDINRRFGPLFWRGEYTHLDPFFAASNFVDDNDNDDPYLDAREPSVPFAGSDRDDRDRDGIKDWDDDFLLFGADPPRFVLGLNRESIDFNNNGVPDSLEDDADPNYRLDYDEGTSGFHTYAIFDVPAARGLSLIPGYYEKNALTTGANARGLYNVVSYEPDPIPGFGRARARYTLRRAHDRIADNMVRGGRIIEDDLRLGDYLGNIFTVIVDYDNVPDLTITTKFKYEYNNLFNLGRKVVDAQLIHQVRYRYRLRDDLTISPAFRSDRVLAFATPFRSSDEENSIRNAFLVTLRHKVAEELQLSAGAQYLTWRDFRESRNDFNRRVGFLELVLQGEAAGQPLGLIATMDFVSQSFLQPVGGDLRSTNITARLFIR
ncbi:hypothetical protein CMK11_05255 [Candidatus Poribacteria bacterium]|nr:hypothetical protein [Candidatus Poribacteria bacterium]